MLTGCLETDGCEGEPLSDECVRLTSKRGREDKEKERWVRWRKREKNGGVKEREDEIKEKMCHQHLFIVYLTEWGEKMSQRLSGGRKLMRVSGPNACQFICNWQEIGSLTTVGPRRLLSQSYSALDGFNLEQLVDDEPIHMVFKSLSVS